MKKFIEKVKTKGIINVSNDTFLDTEVIDIYEVIKICKSINDNKIEVDQDYYKNLEFSIEYDYSPDDVRRVIHTLRENDLHEGPVKDRNPKYKHPFWIFIKYLPDINCKVYIKLKIVNHKLKINVFRFHKEGMHDENF